LEIGSGNWEGVSEVVGMIELKEPLLIL